MVSKQSGYARISEQLETISEDLRVIRNHLERNSDTVPPAIAEEIAETQDNLAKRILQRKSISELTSFIDSTPNAIAAHLIPSGFMPLERGTAKSLFSEKLSSELIALVGERLDPLEPYSYPALVETPAQG